MLPRLQGGAQRMKARRGENLSSTRSTRIPSTCSKDQVPMIANKHGQGAPL